MGVGSARRRASLLLTMSEAAMRLWKIEEAGKRELTRESDVDSLGGNLSHAGCDKGQSEQSKANEELHFAAKG